jgi:hypothetical protein
MWGAIVGGSLILLLAWFGYLWYLDRDLKLAIAEADRLDPGWRLAELEAARAEVPDNENAALQVLSAKKVLPANWFIPSPGTNSTTLEDDLNRLLPNERLDEAQSKELNAELGKAKAALTVARRIADIPQGRYEIVWSPDAIGTLVPHLQDAGEIRRLLGLDAIRMINDGDIEGAIISCRAVLNIGRSVGDETTAVSQIVRLHSQRQALRSLERALAQGAASDAALVKIQQLLEDESDQPLLLIATRADRAGIHKFLEFVEARGHYRTKFGMRSRTGSNDLDEFLDRGNARGCHAAYLRFLNEGVEIAKRPPEEQAERLLHFDKKEPQDVPEILAGLMRSSDFKSISGQFLRSLAFLRCGLTAVAVERYRLASGHWPDRLDDLVPKYLSQVPIDLYDSQPLRYRRMPDGVLIYTIGEDRKDNGGRRVHIKAGTSDADVGFQLWDLERRHQALPGK